MFLPLLLIHEEQLSATSEIITIKVLVKSWTGSSPKTFLSPFICLGVSLFHLLTVASLVLMALFYLKKNNIEFVVREIFSLWMKL